MANGNATAVDVEQLWVDAERVTTVKRLRREGFVELPQSDVVNLQVVRLQKLGDGGHWPDPHFIGCAPFTAIPRYMPSGCTPRLDAASASIKTTADAPSERCRCVTWCHSRVTG